MIKSHSIDKYKTVIKNNIGANVNITMKKGRKYINIPDCTIANAYNGIFVLEMKKGNIINAKMLSVCYADLLIGNVKLTLCGDSKGA